MPDWLIEILKKSPELASVVIVVWFALKMSENFRKSSAIVMVEWREFFSIQENKWREFLSVHEEKWRAYSNEQSIRFVDTLKEIREQNISSTARLAEEIKEISKLVAANNAILHRQTRKDDSRTRKDDV